ncbi:MAG: cytochrome c oxidase subunit 3 [Acidobacteriaceae bacterium]|nr:cytochrome c oxidase subunit 3 [Acidobacteriaceae bacterium]MBV9502027.1 cytochrome c oxidase subunit 3 [Acidobacteriaceae bacterium]
MTGTRTIDVSGLKPWNISIQAPLWWGQLSIILIEATMFSILIATYFYTRLRMDVWPPPGDRFPGLLLPSLALIPLILSAGGSYLASEAAKKNDRPGMIIGLGLNLILAILFFVLRVIEWHSLNFNWMEDIYGSFVWAFLGLHSFDYIAGLVETVVFLVIILGGRYAERERLGIHVDSLVWYFIVGIWIPIYIVIYWGPHLVETAQ